MKKTKIFEQKLSEKCKFTIMRGGLYSNNPFKFISEEVVKYTSSEPCIQFVDIKMNDPWTRIIMNSMEHLPFENFNTFLKKRERKEKLNRINGK